MTTIQIKVRTQEPSLPPLWMHKEDKDISTSSWGGGIRPCAPCPAVWVLKDNPNTVITQQWQYFIRAINYNMSVSDCQFLLEDQRAFANGTGFISRDKSGRADYFNNRDLDKELPRLDKVRTCSRSVLTGRVVGDYLNVTTFDSRQPPPLKPGRSYPTDISNVNPDDYLIMPRTHPWMFLIATIVNKAGECVQFPKGAVYDWTNDGHPRSFMPHISNHDPKLGGVWYPLSNLTRVSSVPSPYRRNE